jgi:hypothetical protein
MSYYRYHVLMCLNRREDGSQCCAQYGAEDLRRYLKGRIRSGPFLLGLDPDREEALTRHRRVKDGRSSGVAPGTTTC